MSASAKGRRAFSLLEVIIATGILAASAVMLMSMFSTGDRHTRRADERTMAQMLCQSKLDELIADPALMVPVEADIIPQYPGWVWSLEVQRTTFEQLVMVKVGVTRIPGMETGANLDLATATEEMEVDATSISGLPEEPTYELTRWMKFEGDITGFADGASFGGGGL